MELRINLCLFTFFIAIAQRNSQAETSEFTENSTGCEKSEEVSLNADQQ